MDTLILGKGPTQGLEHSTGKKLPIQQVRNIAKSKKKYSKEKAAEYYLLTKEAIKKRQKIDTKIWQTKANKQKRISKKLLQEIKGLWGWTIAEISKKRGIKSG